MPDNGWTYEIGAEKLREFRSALAIKESGEVPPGFVFAYAVVPGLARILTHPYFAGRRDGLRLSGIAIRWDGLPTKNEVVDCSVSFEGDNPLITCVGTGTVEVRVMLSHGGVELPRIPSGPVLGERLIVDAGRALAFAAATWDLNPVYWNERFARAAGLDATVVPPGLPAAWVLQMIRRSSGARLERAELVFGHAARPGDELMARVVQEAGSSDFVVAAGDVPVCWGSCS